MPLPPLETWEALLQPLAEELGLDLFSVHLHTHSRGQQLQIVADRQGASGPGTGVTVEELAQLNREIQALLALKFGEDAVPSMEVASPGVERDLKTPKDVRRHAGQVVRAVLTAPVEGAGQVVEGVLGEEGEESFGVTLASGERVSVPWSQVRKVRTVFHFGRSSSPVAAAAEAGRGRKRGKSERHDGGSGTTGNP